MTQRLISLISEDPELRSLLHTAKNLDELQRRFARAVPAHFAQGCQILGLKNGTLNVAASNGTIAAKLRQLAPEITLKLQEEGCEVSGIRVKVQVSYAAPVRKRIPRLLSKTARDSLHELSERMENSPLKNALEKFSKD